MGVILVEKPHFPTKSGVFMAGVQNTRNIGIDLLRAASIVYIVGFWHLMNYTTAFRGYNNLITSRLIEIVLGNFVFISGYLIGQKDLKIDGRSVAAFYKKRLLRIYPLYLIAIGLFTAFDLSSAMTSLKAAAALSMLWQPSPPTLWFITMLMLFYLVSPLLLAASRKLSRGQLILCGLAAIVGLLGYAHLTHAADDRLVLYFPTFACGVYVANRKIDASIGGQVHLWLAALVSSILLAFIETPSLSLDVILHIPMVLVSAYLLFHIAKGLRVTAAPATKAIVFVSYSGYCIYLFHRVVYLLMLRAYSPDTTLGRLAYLLGVCLPCVVLVGYAVQKTYDAVVDRWDSAGARLKAAKEFPAVGN